jgi:hypothetical protein
MGVMGEAARGVYEGGASTREVVSLAASVFLS